MTSADNESRKSNMDAAGDAVSATEDTNKPDANRFDDFNKSSTDGEWTSCSAAVLP